MLQCITLRGYYPEELTSGDHKELWCPLPNRRRSIPSKGVDSVGKRTDRFSSGVTNVQNFSTSWETSLGVRWKGTQVTESEDHPGWRKQLNAKQDVGGNFRTERRVAETKVVQQTLRNEIRQSASWDTSIEYRGPVLASAAVAGNGPFPPSAASTDSALNAWGATAVARCKPTNSVFDASVFLGELIRERLPRLPGESMKEATDQARKAGSEYLNIEFGWRPLAQGVSDFLDSVVRADAVLKQYERDAGRAVRRRYYFPPENDITITDFGVSDPYTGIVSSFRPAGKSSEGKVIRQRESYRKRWFSGAFTYHLPAGYNSRSELARFAARASVLQGLELTPSVVWNLAPWSWAVDWFTNVGDVLSNVSDWATDGLVMRYGYIMEHSYVRDTYTYVGNPNFYSRSVVPQTVSFLTETKIRRRANPFGFGLTWSGLTPRQIAIAAALGLTRRT